MMGKAECLSCILGLGIGTVSGYLCHSYTSRRTGHVKVTEVKLVKNTNKPCKAHIYSGFDCTLTQKQNDHTFECSYSILKWMVEFLDSAKNTLDIAIYLITCVELRDALLNAHQRGVVIRVLTDYTMAKGSGSAIPDFIQQGIPVRMHDYSHMMHRKSCIADNRQVLMGSGNWTMQALAGNWDGWLKTSDHPIVESYVKAFQHQWEDENLLQPTLKQFRDIKLNK